MSNETAIYSRGRTYYVEGVGILFDHSTTVPTDGTADYAPGCIFQKTDGTADACLYINQGTLGSCSFKALDIGTILATNIPIVDTAAYFTATNLETVLAELGELLLNAAGANAGVGPSTALWADCPVLEMTLDPTIGIHYFNDYVERLGGGQQSLTGTSTNEISDWIQTEITSGLTERSEVAGGVLRVSSEAHASANDGLTVMYRATPFIPADGKTIWFEARVAMTNIDAAAGAEDQFFVGLCDVITSALPAGVIDDTVDKVGFFHHDGSITATLSFITEDGDTEEITASAATALVTGDFVKLGFKIEMVGAAETITPYVNGVAGTPHVTEASLPVGVGMGICFAAVSEGTTTALLDIDWVRVAQLK